MSPQKKLMLRRNALFRQQLSTTMPSGQYGQDQLLLYTRPAFFDIQHETKNTGDFVTEYCQQIQGPAEN